MKTLSWFLTAAAILIGADVFIASSDPSATETIQQDAPVTLSGGAGQPTPGAHE